MPAHFRSVTSVLVVEAIEPTIRFFCDRLGFAVKLSGEGGSAVVERDTVSIDIRSAADLHAALGENAAPGPYHGMISVDVDDVDLLVPEVIDAQIVLPLRETSVGRHEIGIREPGGNIIVFGSRRRD